MEPSSRGPGSGVVCDDISHHVYCFSFAFSFFLFAFFINLASFAFGGRRRQKVMENSSKIIILFFFSDRIKQQQQNGSTYENTTSSNGTYNNIRQTSASPTFNSLPRTSTPQKALYSNGNGSATSGNLSELDSLLQDLSNARYGSGAEKKCEFTVDTRHLDFPTHFTS